MRRSGSALDRRYGLHPGQLKPPRLSGRTAVEGCRDRPAGPLGGEPNARLPAHRRHGPRNGLTVDQFVKPEGRAIRVVVIRAVIDFPDREDGAGPDKKRQAEEPVPGALPAAASLDLTGEQMGPATVRKIVIDGAILGEYRRDQQGVAEHVLVVERVARGVAGKLEQHGPHHRHAFLMRDEGLAEEIGHEAALQLGEEAQHVAGFVVVIPRHPIGGRTVQPAMRRKQAEGDPAFVDGRGSLTLEAANVVAPEPEATEAERETPAQRFGHRLQGRPAIAAPVEREPLAGGVGRAGEQRRLTLAPDLLQQFEDTFIVEDGIMVVHAHRIGAVVEDHPFHRDALAKIRLETVHPHR